MTKEHNVVVLVDEDREFDSIIEIKLKSAGFAVHVVDVPSAGLELVERVHPDLVLLDINMPGMNGIEFITKLKEHGQLEYSKVAFFSSLINPWHESEDLQESMKKLGAIAFIDKSVDLDELVKEVRQLVV